LDLKKILPGLSIAVLVAVISTILASTDIIKKTVNFSPLILAILIGAVVGNLIKLPDSFKPGIIFSLKKVLRVAIVFLGFRLTFQNIMEVGLEGLIIDTIMLLGTFFIGIYVSTKIFKLDSSMGYLLASGSSICGASAVLATSAVVKSEMHHNAMAVATVTIFGTIAMFLYPMIYKAGILLDFDDLLYGLWTGATVHEVAQVVAAGFAISEVAGNTATIAKLTRVMMLAPLLIVLSIYLAKKHSLHGATVSLREIPIPYFVFGFIAMVGVNSIGIIPQNITHGINVVDTFLMTVAMAAMGIETNINKMKGVGMKPIYVALIMFLFLFFGGILVVKVVHELLG